MVYGAVYHIHQYEMLFVLYHGVPREHSSSLYIHLILFSQKPEGLSGNSFPSLLNVLGLYGSGILGALYARSQKEKADIESTIALVSNLDCLPLPFHFSLSFVSSLYLPPRL
jgi:hypothetical protein